MIRVVVADDHPLMLKGMVDLLRDEAEIAVVGTATNGMEALEAVSAGKPDVVMLDVSMPLLDGIQTARHLRGTQMKLGILMVSAGGDDEDILASLKAGADGYILKTAEVGLILEALRLVASGKPAFLQPEVSRVAGSSPSSPMPSPEALTLRECEILREVAKDRTNKEIALLLYISDRTVQQHLASAFGKLGATSRTGAVLKALHHGFIRLEECRR